MSFVDDMSYSVEFSRNAERYFNRLDRPTQARIIRALDQLAVDPFGHKKAKPLEGLPGRFRLRVGDYRLIYRVDQGVLLISVITIASRGDVYKK